MKNNLLKFLARIFLLLCCFIVPETQIFGGSEVVDIRPDLYILSVGIDEYEGTRLILAKKDAWAIADEFEKRGKYKFQKIVKQVLPDRDATRANILNQLEAIAKMATADDVFIFSFAGIGYNVGDEFYLRPFDSKRLSSEGLESNISNPTLQSYFRKIRANSKLVILDTGKFLIDRTKIESVFSDENNLNNKENFLLIGTDTTSVEDVKLQNGSITHILLEGLKGNADYNNDGEFSFREIEALMYLNGMQYAAKYKNNFHAATVLKNDFKIALTDKGLVKQAEIAKVEENLKKAKFEISAYLKKGENLENFTSLFKYLEKEKIFMNLNNAALVVNLKYQDRRSEIILLGEDVPDLVELKNEIYQQILEIFSVKSLKIVKKTDKTVFVEKKELLQLREKRQKELKEEIAALEKNPTPELQKYLELLNRQLKFEQSLDIMWGIKPATVPTRSDLIELDGGKKNEERDGDDYALLFYNETFDNPSWRELKNPQNDVEAIAKELKETYGFKEVEIKRDFNTAQIYETIGTYQDRKFEKPQDQLFIFFAGHGYADQENNGYYIGKDSPSAAQSLNTFANRRNFESKFVIVDKLLNGIDRININHIMVVFDICYGGVIWKPIQLQKIEETARHQTTTFDFAADFKYSGPNIGSSFDFEYQPDGNEPLKYARKKMKNRSRIVLTSGDKPVYDSWIKTDGTLSDNSPFADAFLRALRTKGSDDKVLITPEFIPFIDKLDPMPQRGRLSGSDGDFVFVLSEPKSATNPR